MCRSGGWSGRGWLVAGVCFEGFVGVVAVMM